MVEPPLLDLLLADCCECEVFPSEKMKRQSGRNVAIRVMIYTPSGRDYGISSISTDHVIPATPRMTK